MAVLTIKSKSIKAQVYNFNGEIVDTIDLPGFIFNRPWNPDLVHQVFLAQQANRRQIIAHAKGRGEVSGGGKKPWRQKGTGRARHGSIRSPLWKGGGVTHGPTKEKRYNQKINKKMKKAAIYGAISKKLSDQELKIVDSLNSPSLNKTKQLDAALKKFLAQPKTSKKLSVLLVPSQEDKMIFRASANIPKVKSLRSKDLNVEDLLKYKHIIFDIKAVQEMAVPASVDAQK